MKINIQFVGMTASDALIEYTTNQLKKLDKKHDLILNVDVFFKKENAASGKGRICQMELSLYGPRIFASSDEKNYEMAVKETISDLEKQLDKRAKKIKNYL